MLDAGRRTRRAGRRAAGSRTMDVVARIGLACRGVLYLLVGVLALEVALGRNTQADSGGALRTVAAQPLGTVLIGVLAAGLAGLALWKLGLVVYGRETKERLLDAGRAVVYAVLCAGSVSELAGGGASNSDAESQTLTGQAMSLPGGQVLVGLIGGGLVIAGIVLAVQALRRTFEQGIATDRMPTATRRAVQILGITGHMARAVVVAAAGVFVLVAAVTFDPAQAKGLDGTLKSLRDTPAGPYLLGAVALGVCVFAIFSFFETRWYRTDAG